MCTRSGSFSSLDTQLTSVRYKDEVKRGNFAKLTSEDIEYFKQTLGEDGISSDPEFLKEYNIDIYRMVKGQSKLLLIPKTTDEVSRILKYCNDHNLALTPQGGNTGLVAGSVPVFDEIILSTSRMNEIYGLDEVSGILITQSGAILYDLNEYSELRGYIVPLDLASSKKCQIGGNVSTNAGGLRFFRYGSLHETVLGLEAVLPNGEILDCLRPLKKDNTGYGLRHFLIGSEGTLAVVTKVAIQCSLKPKSVGVLLIGTPSFDLLLDCFKKAKIYFQETLSCCEVMDMESMNCTVQNLGLKNPLHDNETSEYFLFLECSNATEDKNSVKMKSKLIKFVKLLDDSVKTFIALDAQDISDIWDLRRGIGIAVLEDGYAYKYDFSIPIEKFDEFLTLVRERLGEAVTRCCGFGHLDFETLSQILDPLMLRFGWADGSSVPEANRDLSTAQNQRLKSIGKLLELVPGMRVLVIGCWSGSVSRHLALVYATSVTTITYGLKSTEITYEKCKNLPVEVRNLEEDEKWEKLIQKNETFDRIIGIEPYRFISQKKQKEFFKLTSDWLVPGGFLLIETQGNSNPRLPLDNLFWQKYFISGGSLPNSTQILKYATSFGFELDYLGNTSHNYFLTISNWRENLLKAHYQLIHCGISEIEYRRWNFALALHAAALETERLQSWEFLFRKHEIVQYN